ILYDTISTSPSPHFFFTATATTNIYSLSLHRRSSDLPTMPPRITPPAPNNASVMIKKFDSSSEEEPRVALATTTPTTKPIPIPRSEEHTSELQSRFDIVCRLLLEKKNKTISILTL